MTAILYASGARPPRRARRGSAMRKRAPSRRAVAAGARAVPPWSSTKRRATARPRPVPLFLPRVTKGSNRRSRISSGARPGPRRRARAPAARARLRVRSGAGRRGGAARARPWRRARWRRCCRRPAQLVHVEGRAWPRRARGSRARPRARAARARARAPAPCRNAGRSTVRRARRPPPRAKSSVSAVMRSSRSTICTMSAARARTSSAGRPRPRSASPRSRGSRSWARGSRGPACRPWCPARPCARRRSAPSGRGGSRGPGRRGPASTETSRASAGLEGHAAAGASARPSTSMPTRPLRAMQRHQRALPAAARGLEELRRRRQVAGSGAATPPAPAERVHAASHLREETASKRLELAVPEQQRRALARRAPRAAPG